MEQHQQSQEIFDAGNSVDQFHCQNFCVERSQRKYVQHFYFLQVQLTDFTYNGYFNVKFLFLQVLK